MQSKLSSVKEKAFIITIILTASCIYISFDTVLSLSGTYGGSDLLAGTEHFPLESSECDQFSTERPAHMDKR